jgi:3-oxoacyl-[acyl-carrier protein] reductase
MVAICSRTKEDLLNTTAEIKSRTGTEIYWNVCDLNSLKDIEETVNTVTRQLGKINILINNCGGPIPGFLSDLTEEHWQSSFEQVFLSTVRFCNLVVPDMILKGWGRIVNITSITVKQPLENLMLSNSFRAGIIGFAKSLSNEVAKYNITVNNVAPGYTLTNRVYDLAVSKAKHTRQSHEEVLADMAKQIPMNRLAKPEEIAAAVAFLVSKQASYITGNTMHIDGGWFKGMY